MQILITGRLQTRNYEDDDGKKHYVTEVIAEEIDFTEKKRDNNSNELEPNISSQEYLSSSDDLPF